MHILPVVHRLEAKYRDELVVIGVHAGKFIAERDTENIRTATRRLGIVHPVVNDRAFRTWRAYNVQAWPTVVLVSPDGQYIGQHSGEITFDAFDQIIGMAAQAYKAEGSLTPGPLDFPLDPAPASDSPLYFPGKALADASGGRLFIADTGHNRILVANVPGDGTSARVVQTIGTGQAGFQDGAFAEATLNHPEGMALLENTLYIADTENHSIRAVDLDAGTLTTIAGTGEQGNTRTGGVGTEFRTIAAPEGRGVFGKSSGGYGAMMFGMKHPEVFGALACHSGDMFFELCYKVDFANFCDVINRAGGLEAWWAGFLSREKKTKDDFTGLNTFAMAACYSPDPNEFMGIALPFDLYTCEQIDDVWARWLDFDPVIQVDKYADNLRRLRYIYLDCGTRDEFHLQYGARIMSRKLADLGIQHDHEEFEDGHMSVQYRYSVSLPRLVKKLEIRN